MTVHSKMLGTNQGIHVDYQWLPADDAAKTAITGTITADVGKLALQIDTGAVWRLDSITPNVWVPSNVHADQHSAAGDDPVTVENLATAGAVGQAALSDGAGALALGGAEDLATAGTTGQTVVSGGAGVMGLGDIEDISTAGVIGTAPISDGAGAVAMGDHGDFAGLGDDDHTQYLLADGTRDLTGVQVGVTPSLDAHLATKQYADNAIAAALDGGVSKPNADAATTAALPANTRTGDVLKADAVGEFPTVDGVLPVLAQVYLVKTEGGGASHINDGIYDLTVLGDGGTEWELTRRSDLDDGDSAAGAYLHVERGTLNGERTFRCINNAGTDVVNTDALQFNFWGQTVDHGQLIGLGDDDHSQYHNDTRGDVRYFQKTEAVDVSAGVADAAKPIKLNGAGYFAGIDSDATTHAGSTGVDHSDVVLNNAHRAGDGSDHADVATNTSHAGSSTNPHSTKLTQYMHLVTGGEVTAGKLTLPSAPVNAECIMCAKFGGIVQASKQVVGATGGAPDFDALLDGTDDFHINNAGTASGLSGLIVENDILIIWYNA